MIKGWNTAIVRKKPSLPMQWLDNNGYLKGRQLDYGCGRGFDAEYYEIDRYDPHWFPDSPVGLYDTITCNYVLNVVTKKKERAIIEHIKTLLTGTAFFTVRRDIKKSQKGRGVIQRLVKLDLPLVYEKKGAFAIYSFDS